MSKKRIDRSGDVKPLTDNPFASLAERAATDSKPPTASSTDRMQPAPSELPFQITKTRKGGLPIFVEKRAKGKTVTVIRNVTGDAQELLRTLKKRCGAGGVFRDGEVEIQGDHCAAVEQFLRGL